MKVTYEEEIARIDSLKYDDEQKWLLKRSRAWEEYGKFFYNLGYNRQAYQCYENAALVTSPCTDCLWVQKPNYERPVMPLYCRFLAMHNKCRHLIKQHPELLYKYKGSRLESDYLYYTEDERSENREMRESYQSLKAWSYFGKV